MKFNILICLFLIMCPLFSLLKVQKSESMMEFYNSLFNRNWAASESESSSESNSELESLRKKTNKSKFTHRSKSEAENLYESRNKNIKVSNSDEAAKNATLLHAYLKINSKLFTIPSLFPSLAAVNKYGKEETVEIKVDKDNWRINETPIPIGNPERDEHDFYFTLTDDYMYYSLDDKDINVLQSFEISSYNINELQPETPIDSSILYCFEIIHKMTKYNYKICSIKKEVYNQFACTFAKIVKQELPTCQVFDTIHTNITPTVINEVIEDTMILIPIPSKVCNDKWNYDRHGEDWECLCKEGIQQSPIDLPSTDKAIRSPVTPLFQFDEVNAKSTITTLDGEIKANQFIKMKYQNGALRVLHHNLGKIVTLNGAVYIAEEITIHTPSEHTIEGKRFDMEIQITFYGQSRGDIAKQVVLSFLFEKKAGYYNRFLDDLDFYNLPNQGFREKQILNNLFIPKILYSITGSDDIDEVPVMKPFSFYTYDGSLTLPPCSEDTIHYIASEPIAVGSVVLDLAIEALKMPDVDVEGYNEESSEIEKRRNQAVDTIVENYRNIQERNDRAVFYFDHKKYCGENINNIIPDRPRRSGHYEKVKRRVDNYIFVPGDEPSHIPGSFVVSEKESKLIVDSTKED